MLAFLPILAMDVSARRVLCARCRVAFLLCRRCDRGQRYCGAVCSTTVRRERQSESNRRYRKTVGARRLNAQRQQHFRARQKRVTDQGSVLPVVGAVLTPDQAVSVIQATSAVRFPSLSRPRCHFCGEDCSDFVRLRFLRSGESGVFPG